MVFALSDAAQAFINLLFGEAGIVILVAGGVGLYLLWYLRGRDAPVGLVAEYLREPPSDLHPGVVGTLVDEHANYHDVVATLVNLGERGALRIRPIADRRGQVRDHAVEFVRRDLPLSPVETLLFELLFGPVNKPRRDRVILGKLRDEFARAVPRFKLALYEEVVAHGFFTTSPRAVRARYWNLGCSVAVAALVIGVPPALFLPGFRLLLVPVAAIVILGLAVYRMARAMPVKTRRGAEEAARWLAFRRYLADIRRYEGDVAEIGTIFRRYLPYATAFGLEQQWIRTFKEANAPAPAWYDPGQVVVTHGHGGHYDLPPLPGSFSMPDLGNVSSSLPTGTPDLSGVGDGVGTALQAASEGGGAGLELVSEGLSGLLDAAASIFDW